MYCFKSIDSHGDVELTLLWKRSRSLRQSSSAPRGRTEAEGAETVKLVAVNVRLVFVARDLLMFIPRCACANLAYVACARQKITFCMEESAGEQLAWKAVQLMMQYGIGCMCDSSNGVKICREDDVVFCLPEALLRENAGALGMCLDHKMMESVEKAIRVDPAYGIDAVKLTFVSASVGIPVFAFADCPVDTIVEAVLLMEQYCFKPEFIEAAAKAIEANASQISLEWAYTMLRRLSDILDNPTTHDSTSSLRSLQWICAAKVASDTPDYSIVEGLQDFPIGAIDAILPHVQPRTMLEHQFSPQAGVALFSDDQQEVQTCEAGDWTLCAHFTEDFTHLTATVASNPGIYQFVSSGTPSLLGVRIRVLWSRNKWYPGVVTNVTPFGTHHTVQYDDGDRRTYDLRMKTFQIWDGQHWQQADHHSHRCLTRYGKRLPLKYNQVVPRSNLFCAVMMHTLEHQFQVVTAWLTPEQQPCLENPVHAFHLYKAKVNDAFIDEDLWRNSFSYKVLVEYTAFAMVQRFVSLVGLDEKDVEALLAHSFHSDEEADSNEANPVLHPELVPALDQSKARDEMFVLQSILEWAFPPVALHPKHKDRFVVGGDETDDEDADNSDTNRANKKLDDAADLALTTMLKPTRPSIATVERLMKTYVTPHIRSRSTSDSCFRFSRWLPITIRQHWEQHQFLGEISHILDDQLCKQQRAILLFGVPPA